ncbi:hypothetical protein [Alkalicoccus chagannorensis]|uniref:hypothetical protein n=1 Tax=Alkalicoccus chagannorensis TaxID=427072 RepID=UPI0004085637|nr:hypothetical protein [Alkalicoccus chagannorensis]
MLPRRYHYMLYTSVILLYIIGLFLPNFYLHTLTAGLTILLFVLSVPFATRLFKILGGVFTTGAAVLMILYPEARSGAFFYVTENLSLLGLLLMLPWMNSVVRAGKFDKRINQMLAAEVPHLGSLYDRALVTSYTLVTFINLSALSLSQDVLRKNLAGYSEKLQQSFISRTTLRAFAVALCWSPMEILVAISVDATGISYFTMLPYLMLVSFLVLTMDGVFGRLRYRSVPYEPLETTKHVQMSDIVKPILVLTAALAAFMMLIVVIGNSAGLDFILTVTLVIFPFAFIWSILMQRRKRFLIIGFRTWVERTNHMQNFVLLFVSLAFFSSTLNETPVLEQIQAPFLAMEETPWVVLVMIQLTYLAGSMAGIHPIATIAVLIEAVQPMFDTVNPLSFAIVFVTGALATAAVGTYGVTVTMTAMNTSQNPYRITARNMPFALLYGSTGTIIAVLLL